MPDTTPTHLPLDDRWHADDEHPDHELATEPEDGAAEPAAPEGGH